MTNQKYFALAYSKIPEQTELTIGEYKQLAYNEELLDIMTNADPVKYILDVFNKYHVGDRDVAKLLLLSVGCQSIINSDGIQVSIIGKTGGGKSDCCEVMSRLMPQKYIKKTELSPKAIYHLNDWVEGTVLFSNDVKLSDQMEKIIKRSTDIFKQGEDNYEVAISNTRNIILNIPQKITWWLTSVKGTKNLEVLDRFCNVKIDESLNQDYQVLDEQRYKMGSPFKITENVKICRDIIQIIKNKIFKVTVPKSLTNKISWGDDTKNRRRYPMFKEMIKSFAIFNQMKRKIKNDKLFANEEDIENAMSLYNSIQDIIPLDEEEMEIWDIIFSNKNITGWINRSDIKKFFEQSKTKTVKTIKSLLEKIPYGTIQIKRLNLRNGGREFYYKTKHSPLNHAYRCNMDKPVYVKWL